ncbi:MAG: ATP-dependent metallopeptidase FtsH/Yme1/Tma family protein, partial [Tissierellia bacterium]|nr:ATP-dependent metallopeptidase FtsH/Yme1/Tma family protein [Tissierellia bacterium]
MKEQKYTKKPFIYYYLIAMAIIIILNALVFPYVSELKGRVERVDYGTFLKMVESGEVTKVEIDDKQIAFLSNTNEDIVYVTGKFDDPNLIDRLRVSNPDIIFDRVYPKESTTFISAILSWVLPLLIFIGIGQLFAKRMQKRMGASGALQFGKSNAKIYVESTTGKTFDDVAGQDEAKEALTEIVDFLNNPKKYEDIGASMPKGALLVGPPGTGKTLLAQAVAGEAKVPFFSISGSEFVEMFVGMGAAKVRDLFKQAQEKAPCIVFIDEIDTIGKKRDSGGIGGNDEREQTLNQLLTEMDGFDGNKGVVILAATNRPESLDKALLRPGRFDRRIPVELPDLAGREAILKVHAKKVKTEDNIDYNAIARAT